MKALTEVIQHTVLTNGHTPDTLSEAEQPQRASQGSDCSQCGGLGFVIPDVEPDDPAFGRAVPCTCKAEEVEAQRRKKLSRISQIGALSDCLFDTFIADGIGLLPTHQRNLRLAYTWARDYAENPAGWLIFKGSYGCGKTHLAAAIANHQLAQAKPVLFVNVPDLLDHLRSTYAPTAEAGYDERFEQVRSAPFLILDDLGTQYQTEWAEEKLYQIFNYRYNVKLPTVITTNIDIEDMDARIRSRLADPSLSQVITITAPDFRAGGADFTRQKLSTLSLYTDQTFATFYLRDQELSPAETGNLRRALETARTFASRLSGWLVFQGINYGSGKTHLAAAIAHEVERQGIPVVFSSVPDLMDTLRAGFNKPNENWYRLFEEVKTAGLLVLDDLGNHYHTGWTGEKLYQIINYRYQVQLPTVITTAQTIDEIDPRLLSRLLDGRTTFFVIEAPSYYGGQVWNKAPAKKPRRSGKANSVSQQPVYRSTRQ